MNRIQRILCAVDFSPESHGAAEYAARLSRAVGAPMALLHSHHVPAMAAYGRAAAPDFDVFIPGPGDERHELDLWVSEFRAEGMDVVPLFVEGSPAAAFARNTEPGDLLIVGTHASGDIGRALLGSTAERIMRHAHCPTLIVPPAGRRAAIRTILVATDFSAASRHALRLARDFARLLGARVHALHVVADERVKSHEHYEVHEHVRGLIDAATVDLAAMLAEYPDVQSSVGSGIPHREIVAAVDEIDADAIAMGLHGHNPIEAAFLGSTANRVLRHAPCPVLVTR
jgi:nucleotide-binding universal stress UspA family protein